MKFGRFISLVVLSSLLAGCAQQGGYGSFVASQLGQVRNYQFGANTTNVSGPSNRVLAAAEYRSDIQADTAENYARGQHAELSVVDHKLYTAGTAEALDHRAHMDGNEENRDDFWTIDSITGSISGSASNVNSTINTIHDIFH
jgi:hypothetical protein